MRIGQVLALGPRGFGRLFKQIRQIHRRQRGLGLARKVQQPPDDVFAANRLLDDHVDVRARAFAAYPDVLCSRCE